MKQREMRRSRSEPGRRRLNAAAGPHMAGRENTRSFMLDILIALTPALLIAGTYFFGPRAFLTAGVSAAACVIFEALCCLAARKRQTVGDLSAVVTGVLLALTLPAGIPLWAVVAGDFFAIVIVKALFGGLGKNLLNPALAGRVFLFSFPALMSAFPASRAWEGLAVDTASAATPMTALRAGVLPNFTLEELFTGVRGGSMGEVSAALLLLGGAYLMLRGRVHPRIPLCFLGTVAVLNWFLAPSGVSAPDWVLCQLMGGGLLLGAFFMAPDPATSPVKPLAQALYGVGCGLLTVLLRAWGPYPEGTAFAVLMMNLCAWPLDKLCRLRPGGGLRKGREGAKA